MVFIKGLVFLSCTMISRPLMEHHANGSTVMQHKILDDWTSQLDVGTQINMILNESVIMLSYMKISVICLNICDLSYHFVLLLVDQDQALDSFYEKWR